ncbi:MAG: type II toxin-antitoxin system RatA family toxin [Gammaproteobacteria bacterium]|nr:type II toxin-antitoxin system RatA family toxin [Gammaproteobacteria bacterium]
MATISRKALVMYSCEQMYDLVNDIETYPEFIPGCADAKCISKSEQQMEGALLISKLGVSKWFSTTNTLVPNQQIKLQLRDGPFKKLVGVWSFTELDANACKVELNIEFEFSSKLIELAFGKVFNQVISSMVTAFTQRAKQIYG